MPNNEIDITGLSFKANPDWEERAQALCKPENFKVTITYYLGTADSLTLEETNRLEPKLKIVEEFASYMAAGQLKGTIKYAGDGWEVAEWFSHLIGEGADFANYQMLLFKKWQSEQIRANENEAATQ